MPLFEGKKVMMYCTGGIRCEKATAYLKTKGVDDVYQLEGGIHMYMERFTDGGLFQGKNFVFDKRGAMACKGAKVVGKCSLCQGPWDTLAGDRVCCVCREPLLVCPDCKVKAKGPDACCFESLPLFFFGSFANYFCGSFANHRSVLL